MFFLRKFGAGEGIRTLDPDLGKVLSQTFQGTVLRYDVR
jgi:hypothetical protein